MNEIRWPQTIPKGERIRLDTGHRSFCLHRRPVGDQFNAQSIRLTGHLLILVVSGCVVVERGAESRVVEAGEAVVIPEGQILLTEVPAAHITHGEAYFFFFHTGVLRDVSATNAGVEEVALRVPPWPGEIGVVPRGYSNLTTFILGGQLKFPWEFSKILTLVTHQFSATIFAFLTREFFLPKLRLNLFMEEHLFETPAVLGDAYPGGGKQLDRALRLFQGLSVDQWLRRRRSQLARLWMGEPGANKEAIAAKLGYSGVEDLQRELQRGKLPSPSSSWKNVQPVRRRLLSAPFWLPPPAADDRKGISASFRPEPTRPPEPSLRAEELFWSGTATVEHMANVILFQFGSGSPATALVQEIEQQRAA